jgi:AraC family transcriptional regulator of adaptative response / DNA-3-methyladenine glycosylase II
VATQEWGLSAVLTTGIYCRPGCSARPRPEHVVTYGTPAAAEAAGFRACLRCRPYRAAGMPRWLDGPELVCRAVQLVLGGALDEAGEDALAARLGVSARHLRRLFDAHVGATPDQLARSRRAHFARRLLDDTDLPIAQVAFAAGFGSVRQMNRVMRDVFRASPQELRARRRRADRLVADGGLDLRLPYRPPLAYGAMLAFFAARATPGIECVDVAASTYRRTILVDGHPGVVEVRPGDEGHLVLRAHLPRWEGLIHLVERARRLFDLDADPAALAPVRRRDPLLRPLVGRVPGLRPAGCWDSFETGVRALLGQQVSVAAATTLAGRVVARWGTPVPGLGLLGLTHLFPPADVLAEADLAAVGMPVRRAEAIRGFAAAVAGGSLSLDPCDGGLEAFVERLCALAGVGPWTAQYLALRLGERDAFPAADLGLRRALGVPAVDVEPRAEAWRPWRAYAATYLWASLAAADAAGGAPRRQLA